MRLKYFPVDISPAALDDAKRRIKEECPLAVVKPVVADFAYGFSFLRDIPNRKVILYLGSRIGNFDWSDATTMLRNVREQLSSGDALLLGIDMVIGAEFVAPDYDDSRGITASLTMNNLVRSNHELGGALHLSAV